MKDSIKYSILVVCLNPGKRIEKTLASVFMQKDTNYEIIIKDGGSTDGSLVDIIERLAQSNSLPISEKEMKEKVTIITSPDQGIYDAMNQVVTYANGEYLLFLNAGDDLYQDTTLSEVTSEIQILQNLKQDQETSQSECIQKELGNRTPDIVYGNLYHKALGTVIYASPEINDFTCYRNVPCHQTCFYKKSLFQKRGYNPKYNVRADYEHFLWCYYEEKATISYVPVIVASYEGGGYSETTENRKRSSAQHREIVVRYMGKKKANHYRRIMWLTLAPVRSKIAESEKLSKVYNKIKTSIYKMKKN